MHLIGIDKIAAEVWSGDHLVRKKHWCKWHLFLLIINCLTSA